MNRIILIIVTGMLSLVTTLSSLAQEKKAPVLGVTQPKKKRTIADFELHKIHGWDVYIEKSAKTDPQYKKSVDMINVKLGDIAKVINPEILIKLRKVKIWLNHQRCPKVLAKSWLERS